MAKSKDKSNAETLKAVIRKQKKVIRELSKKAGRGEKTKNNLEDMELELAERLLEEETADSVVFDDSSCPECSKGKLEKIDLKVRKMFVCSDCSYRKIIK